MLVLDMDDTLLTDDHKISDLNKKVLLEAQAKGVHLVLASGRPTSAMTAYAKELQLDLYDSYIISFNGAVISTVKDDLVLFEQCLTPEQIHDLYDYSVKMKTHILPILMVKLLAKQILNTSTSKKKSPDCHTIKYLILKQQLPNLQ